ncbi:PREDICTED: telethonin [Nanorana parkeri]|uniref:telethonin n=1 Tax=Nanorana parkeri TaxID=125878 RepID=UPI000854BEF8|nr:PREDICTED: telethonin [Nanorana parkeri]
MKPEKYEAHSSLTDLSCEVKEANKDRREHYSAEWLDTSVFTRPEERCTARDANVQRKESFSQQGQTHFLVQRSPAQIMKMGRLGHHFTQYQLPFQQMLPLPIFKPADLTFKMDRMGTPPQLRSMIEFERALSNPGSDGICQNKTPVSQITKELPPLMQPARMEFAKPGLAESFCRSVSQEAQRG